MIFQKYYLYLARWISLTSKIFSYKLKHWTENNVLRNDKNVVALVHLPVPHLSIVYFYVDIGKSWLLVTLCLGRMRDGRDTIIRYNQGFFYITEIPNWNVYTKRIIHVYAG